MKVVFYVSRGADPEVLAVFPEEPASVSGPDLMLCYAHLGQHGSARGKYLKGCRLATPEEYSDLQAELEDLVGYDLEILPRMPRGASNARCKQWRKEMGLL